MAACVQPCSPPPDDLCEALRRLIDDMVNRDKHVQGGGGTHGLVHRFREQINGANGPGTRGWTTHDTAIRNQQRGLRSRLQEYINNRCGPPPPGAWNWATRPAPTPSEWRDPNAITGGDVARVGGTAIVGAGVAYGIYRGVRMLPSLAPPLWWTLPGNLAIP
jgi:hypothetical protein